MGSMDVSSLYQDLLREKEANYRNGIYGCTRFRTETAARGG